MVLITALQLELKCHFWKVNTTASMHLAASAQSWQLLAHGDIQGLQFHKKDGFGNPSIPGGCSVRSILPCSIPIAEGEEYFPLPH